ncbi:hypothetical protein QBC44DRAFT_399293 [Cladorrhinum sp. PSN332]|nr:hypothetical protein QBC44DRAFT_399293 [Cladorrhinum sp. PSN332]
MNQLEKSNTSSSRPMAMGASHYHTSAMLQNLEKCQGRLFISDPVLAVLQAFTSDGAEHCLSTGETFSEFLNERSHGGSGDTAAFFITAKTTWSRLRLTYSMFSTMAAAMRIPPDFFDLLTTFGYRTADTDAVYQASFSSFQDGTYTTFRDRFDLCYNLRYVDLNERSSKDPWSFRNFAVLHMGSHDKLLGSTGFSGNWLFVSLPLSMKNYIQQRMRDNSNGKSEDHQLLWHAYIFGAMLGNWRSYLNFLDEMHQQILKGVRLSAFKTKSGKGLESKGSTIDVMQCQQLESLHARIQKALCILRSYSNLVRGVMHHARGLQKQGGITIQLVQVLSVALRRHSDIIAGHIRHLEGLLASSNFTMQSIFHLRESHASAMLEEKMQHLGNNLDAATTLWQRLVTLNRRFTQDSGATRIATIVALMYSSAGIVAVSTNEPKTTGYGVITFNTLTLTFRDVQAVFNSNLIEVSSADTSFSVRGKEMSIFVASAASLVFLTMLYIWVCERKEQRKLQLLN